MNRILELIIIAVLFPVWGVLMGCLSLLCWIIQGRPVFFLQTRIGLNERKFEIIKFRTMESLVETGEHEVTKLGKLLRRWSLDEVPEIFNVILGHMSLVGPRPLLSEYLCYYTAQQGRRHLVRPGLTGLAQIRGRNSITWAEKFLLDVEYVERRCCLLDIKILLMTIPVVLSGEGVETPGGGLPPSLVGKERQDGGSE